MNKKIVIAGVEKAIEKLNGLEYVQAAADGQIVIPFMKTLSIKFEEVARGRVVLSMVPTEEFNNSVGTMHGGAIGAILDAAGSLAARTLVPAGKTYTTVSCKTDYYNPVTENTGKVLAIGKVREQNNSMVQNGNIILSNADLRNEDGDLLATSAISCKTFLPR